MMGLFVRRKVIWIKLSCGRKITFTNLNDTNPNELLFFT